MTEYLSVVRNAPEAGSEEYEQLLARARKALAEAVDVQVPATDICRYENQPRKYFNEDGLANLSESIKAGGQIQPGLIRKKAGSTPYELIDGERRWRAVLRIDESERPLYKASLIDADDEVVQFLIAGIANSNREGHTPLETMDMIERYLQFKFPMPVIAKLLGISVLWAYQLRGLQNLTPEVKMLLDAGLPRKDQLPLTAAIHISKMAPHLQGELSARVMLRDVSLASLRTEVVEVSKAAGSPVRIRQVDARKKFSSVTNKAEVVTRALADITKLLSDTEVNRIIENRSQEVDSLIIRLRKAQELTNICITTLELRKRELKNQRRP